MTQTAHIDARLPGLNEYVRANRSNRYAGAKMKRETEELCAPFLRNLKPVTRKVTIIFIWHEKALRRDLDNVAFAKKFILDTLTRIGVLPDDSPKWVVSTIDGIVKADSYGVTITITEAEK